MAAVDTDPKQWEDRGKGPDSLALRLHGSRTWAQTDSLSRDVLTFDRALDGRDEPEVKYRVKVQGIRQLQHEADDAEVRTHKYPFLLREHAELLIKNPRFAADLRQARRKIRADIDATWAPARANAEHKGPRAVEVVRQRYEHARMNPTEQAIGSEALRLRHEPRYEGIYDTLRNYCRVQEPYIMQALKAALRGTWDDAVTVLIRAAEGIQVSLEHEYADRLVLQR